MLPLFREDEKEPHHRTEGPLTRALCTPELACTLLASCGGGMAPETYHC